MISLFKIHAPPNVGVAIQRVFDSGFITEGSISDEFERELSSRFRTHTSLTNSGTSALTLAYRMCGVGPGTEVISTPMTCMATNAPIHSMGAKIVWADVDPNTGNIDPTSIAKKITARTVAIVGVHWSGMPIDVDGVYDVINKSGKNIKLITDAAHAFGASYKGLPIGSEADYVCFSFQAIKHLTTCDGGAVTSRSLSDDARIKKLRWFGLDRKFVGDKWSQDITDSGYKFHMNNVNAAIGLEQLKYVDDVVNKHIENAKYYYDNLNNQHVVPLTRSNESTSSCWIFTVRVKDREKFKKHMNSYDVACDVVHYRNDLYNVFDEFRTDDLPGVEQFCSEMINVPVGWWLTSDERACVLDAMNSYVP